MAEKSTQPVVIKKVVKGGGHHGGSWKVAYADFVTAMMAFFLLMWLMATTNQEQRAAISEYFKNPSAEIGTSPNPSASAVQIGTASFLDPAAPKKPGALRGSLLTMRKSPSFPPHAENETRGASALYDAV